MSEQRLNDLEVRYTHQQALIEDLSDLIRDQHMLITRLKNRIDMLEERADSQATEIPNEPPPHY